jgi:hypothetical protein
MQHLVLRRTLLLSLLALLIVPFSTLIMQVNTNGLTRTSKLVMLAQYKNTEAVTRISPCSEIDKSLWGHFRTVTVQGPGSWQYRDTLHVSVTDADLALVQVLRSSDGNESCRQQQIRHVNMTE